MKTKIKKITYFVLGLLFVSSVNITAQVTMGSQDNPHTGAALDLKSETKGLLLSRISLNDVNVFQLDETMANPATTAIGMIVYNTNASISGGKGAGIYVWDGGRWLRVEKTNGTVVSPCGAWVNARRTQWLPFMCYNLGANENLDSFTYNEGILGDLYQWGRATDGHEKRSSTSVTGPATIADLDSKGQIATGNSKYGKYIMNSDPSGDWRTPQDDNLWGDLSKSNPCPEGWTVPSLQLWEAVMAYNDWTWTGNGYKIGNSLFLPAAGSRLSFGDFIGNVGEHGCYWSSTAADGTIANAIRFTESTLKAEIYTASYNRAEGVSVRCVVKLALAQ